MGLRAAALACSLALAMGSAPARAADPTDPTDPTRPSLAYTVPPASLRGTLELSLEDAIRMGLENNLGVEIQRHAPLIAHDEYRAAWGLYDPELFGEAGYTKNEDPTANFLLGAGGATSTTIVEGVDGFGGVRGLLPWIGASYEIRLDGSHRRNNISIQALSPEIESAVSFTARVPLLRGLIWNEPWTLVKTNAVLEASARESFRRDVMDTVQIIEARYWALVADDERVRVAEKSVETAKALLDQVQTQYEVGVVSKVEISEAEAGLAARDFDEIVARNRYQNAMDELVDQVLGPNLTADSDILVVPTDRPDEYVAYAIDADQATRVAFEQRPELVIAQSEIERLEIGVKFAKNQRLPQFDTLFSYGNRGLAGSQSADFNCNILGDPAAIADCLNNPIDLGGYGNTFDDYFSGDAAAQFVARGIVTVPFPNTTGRANVSRAELQLRRAIVQRRRVEQDIILEVRRAVRDLRSSQQGIEAAARQRDAAAEQLRAERVRLEYGESTPFDVLLREQDLVSAEQGYIAAFQAYRNSVTNLDRFQGTILRNRNIHIADVARLR